MEGYNSTPYFMISAEYENLFRTHMLSVRPADDTITEDDSLIIEENPHLFGTQKDFLMQLENLRKSHYDFFSECLKPFLVNISNTKACPTLELVEARFKTTRSMIASMIKKNRTISDMRDSLGLRIVVQDEDDIYSLFELIESNMPGEFDIVALNDYFENPKINPETGGIAYKGFHIYFKREGEPFVELQLHTPSSYFLTVSDHKNYKKRPETDWPVESASHVINMGDSSSHILTQLYGLDADEIDAISRESESHDPKEEDKAAETEVIEEPLEFPKREEKDYKTAAISYSGDDDNLVLE